MIRLGQEAPGEAGAREMLLDRAMGPERRMKASELVREGRRPATGLSLVARERSAVVGSVRLWHVDAGGKPALLLGPLAVDPARQGEGIGSRLMRLALDKARRAGHGAVILVGDPEYYGRFGFKAALASGLAMPGTVEARRFLALELVPGALAGAAGPVVATGARIRIPGYEHAAQRLAA
jgi:predicted N-acetyltransferase YhbS